MNTDHIDLTPHDKVGVILISDKLWSSEEEVFGSVDTHDDSVAPGNGFQVNADVGSLGRALYEIADVGDCDGCGIGEEGGGEDEEAEGVASDALDDGSGIGISECLQT